jgi:hypothetical protein
MLYHMYSKKHNGYLYFTVELIEPEEWAHAYSEG